MTGLHGQAQHILLPLTTATPTMQANRGVWTEDEHNLFLEAIQLYPHGPWRSVAEHVGTRDVRQVQTHAQKYYEKINRHVRGLRKERRSWVRAEHRMEALPLQAPQSEAGSSIPHHLPVPFDTDSEFSPLPYYAQDGGHSDNTINLSLESPMALPTLEESLDMLLEYLAEN